jgi:hypothetical protein
MSRLTKHSSSQHCDRSRWRETQCVHTLRSAADGGEPLSSVSQLHPLPRYSRSQRADLGDIHGHALTSQHDARRIGHYGIAMEDTLAAAPVRRCWNQRGAGGACTLGSSSEIELVI